MRIELLPFETISELYEAAATLERAALIAGMDPVFVLTLPVSPSPGTQLLSDLQTLNGLEPLEDGSVPLRRWLQNAILRAGPTGKRPFENALRKLDSKLGRGANGNAEPSPHNAPPSVKAGARSLLDPSFSWSDPRAPALRDILMNAYDDLDQAEYLAKTVPIKLGRWKRGPSETAWTSLIDCAVEQDKLRDLLLKVLSDGNVRGYWKRILELVPELAK